MLARTCLSRIMEMLGVMGRIADSKTGKVALGDGTTIFALQVWSKRDRSFLRQNRNLFAHGETTVHPDGTIQIFDHRDGRTHEFKLPDLMELEKRLQDAIFGVANPTLAIRQICQTCGDTVLGHELLRCGHVAYGESDAVQPVLGRKPRGATLDIRLTWGKPNNETTQAPGKMVLTRAGMRGLLKSMDAIDSQLPRLKCGCENYAVSDGYCRRCRATSGPESAT